MTGVAERVFFRATRQIAERIDERRASEQNKNNVGHRNDGSSNGVRRGVKKKSNGARPMARAPVEIVQS